jgi:hypothetical protein
MSTGGVFQLITNDGRQDEMLLATGMLRDNLIRVKAAKMAAKMDDTDPDIADIEVTHFFPLISHFKPCVAVAYEYQIVNPQNMPQWGGQYSFSLPQFGEFISDCVVSVTIDQVAASNAGFWTASTQSAPVGAELISYVNRPGHAFFDQVSFDVNGNVLDIYSKHVVNFHYKFYVSNERKLAWDRLVGQEIPATGYSSVVNSGTATATYRNSGVRQIVSYVDGYQTPKPVQPPLTMFIPVLTWFCLDPSKALPSVAIPYGQRFMHFNVPQINALMQQHHAYYSAQDNYTANQITANPTIRSLMYVNNIFVNNEIHDLFVKRIGFYLIRVHREQQQIITSAIGRELLQNVKWPVETIFSAFQPVVNTSGGYRSETWNQYGFPTTISVAGGALQNGYHWGVFANPTNITAANYDAAFQAFTNLAIVFETVLGVLATTVLTVAQLNWALQNQGFPPLVGTNFANAATPTSAEIIAATPTPYQPSYYIRYTPTVTNIQYQAQSIALYPNILSQFFTDYIPFLYVNDHMRTSDDIGAYMTTFSLYTDVNQPSGYINVSRAREFYINYTSSFISVANQVNLIIVAVAINFLLVSDGSAVLRFAT